MRDFTGNTNYKFGDITKTAVSKFTGKDEYEFGDVSKKLGQMFFGNKQALMCLFTCSLADLLTAHLLAAWERAGPEEEGAEEEGRVRNCGEHVFSPPVRVVFRKHISFHFADGASKQPATHADNETALHMSCFATEKPFAGVQRQRHDSTNGRVALHGHTARAACRYSSFERDGTTDKLSRQLPMCRNHDSLDKNKAYGTQTTSRLAEPYALTALELNGVEAHHSLQKANAWAAVPALLAENCVGLPSSRRLTNGKVETKYQLLPEGMLMPDPAVAAAEHKLNTHLYEIKRRRPQLQAVFPTEPPEGVTSPLLKATLKCRGVHVPQSAIVRVNASQPVESAAFGGDAAR